MMANLNQFLCSQSDFPVYNRSTVDSNWYLSQCFQSVFIISPVYALLAIISSLRIGWNSGLNESYQTLNRSNDWLKRLMQIKAIIVLTIMTIVLIDSILISVKSNQNNAYYISIVIEMVSLFVHLIYSTIILKRNHLRNANQTDIAINLTVILMTISSINQLYTTIVDQNSQSHQFICALILMILWSFYFINNMIIWRQYKSSAEDQNHLIESSGPVGDIGIDYESIDNQLLNDQNVSIISKTLLLWVGPLMRRGIEKKISSHNDLFRLPDKLMSKTVFHEFDSVFQLNPNSEDNDSNLKSRSLVKSLIRCYGLELLFIGLLKFTSDVLSFAGPLLLNRLVLYLESDDHNSTDGFYFALGLFLSTLLSSLSISLFNFYINNISLKIRSSLIACIYTKIFAVRANTLNSNFDTGQVLTLASTDIDRTVNLSPSLLQFLTLPVQLTVCLILLYQQLGLAFISGLVFAIVLIPINRWICNKIGALSSKMMEWKDKRIKLMSEVLMGIRVIKMHGWEDLFLKRINQYREEEIKYLKGRKYLDAFCVYFWATTPVLISSLVFGTFVLMNGKLTAPTVFTSLALLGMLIMPLNAFPWVLNGLMESWISIKRLQKLFALYPMELNKHYNHKITESSHKIEVIGGSFNLSDSSQANSEVISRFVLGPIDFTLTEGTFIGVIGKVGSGKSSLINAVLGQMQRISGRIGINQIDFESGIGVVLQEPWIQNTTLMENILFGKPFDSDRYHSVLDACALTDDINIFPERDLTLIGDRGVTLSGGQKARISLARAIYQDFDIYLLDDPFASVDIHVAEHIYNKCISGLLKNKSKILCTHHQKYLMSADLVLRLDAGQQMASGAPNDVLKIKDKSIITDKTSANELDVIEINDNIESKVKEEEREEGAVRLDVYITYLKSVGLSLSAFILVSILLMQISKTASDCWLAFWTSNNRPDMTSKSSTNYLIVFGCIAAINSVLTLIRSFVFAYGGIVAALRLHRKLLSKILRAPVLFFDLTPFGRLINRFSSDIFNVDDALPFTLNVFLANLYSLLASLVITVYGLPWIAILVIPLSIPYYLIQRYYRWTSRELKRLSAVSLSPIYAQLDETLQGSVTIRAFANINRFMHEIYRKLDINNKIQYASAGCGQWLNLRLQILGILISSGVALLAVSLHFWSKQSLDSGLVGLALVYCLSITALLNGAVQSFAQTEMDMVSVERVVQYINDIQSEEKLDFSEPHSSHSAIGTVISVWPQKGIIEFKDVSMRYRPEMQSALQKVSFTTKTFEKLGIVGRTGSGKSSLFQVLFRLVNIEEGNVSIDGIDISTISLKQLRSNLFIIPQDPFLFSGTIKDNLDPRSQYSDNEIWHSLRECHLESLVLSLGGLSANISERGRDLSVGQRQLICLVRALLTKTKVLCLDECTSSIDYNTEKLIQQTLRNVFSSATVLFVAHKIESVLSCDRIIVMDTGRVAEIGSPDALLHNSDSMFYSLCNP